MDAPGNQSAGGPGRRTDHESRSADPRAPASVTAMDIAVPASLHPHDDPDALSTETR
jgi:hypothetical protein